MIDSGPTKSKSLLYFNGIFNQSTRFLITFSFLGSDCQIIRSENEFITFLQEIFEDHLVYLPILQHHRFEDLQYLLNHSVQVFSEKDDNFLFDQGNKKGQTLLNFLDPTLAQSRVTSLIMNHYLQRVHSLESSIERIENHVENLEQVLFRCQALLVPNQTNLEGSKQSLPDMNQMHHLASTSVSTVEYSDQPTIHIQREEQIDADEARFMLKALLPNLPPFYPACNELLSKLLLFRQHQYFMSSLDDLKEYVKSQIQLLLKCSVVEACDELVGIPLTGSPVASPTSSQALTIQLHVLVRDDMDPDWIMMLYSHFKDLEMLSNSSSAININEDTGKQIIIRDLTVSQSSGNQYVRFLINDIPVKILNDPSHAISMYALIEEISDFIGRDHLLKRSYLLIRSFFMDEIFPSLQFPSPSSTMTNNAVTPTTMTTTTLTPHSTTFKNLLTLSSSFYSPRSSSVIPAITNPTTTTNITSTSSSVRSTTYDTDDWWIMTLSIFNRYLPLIEHPLQALVSFCFEYSAYYEAIDTKKQAHFISLFGVIDVDPMTSLPINANSTTNPSSSSFLSSSGSFLLDPHSRDLMKVPIRIDSNYHFPSSILLKYSILLRRESNYINQSHHNLYSMGDFLLPLQYPSNLLTSKSLSGSSFLIFHPLRGNVTQNKAFSMKVFHYATIQLLLKLRQLQNSSLTTSSSAFSSSLSFSSPSSLYSKDLLSSDQFSRIFSPMVHARISSSFASSSLPPVGNSRLSSNGPGGLLDLRYSMPKDRLLYYPHYCNLINKIIVTEPALLVAAVESLEMKGALPVGEVGKAMAQHSNIVVVSKYIKDKYTGLKKFLERFPLIFVLSNDHSYNPHVYLRSKLTQEHLTLVSEENVLPIEIMINYRAGKPSRTVLKQLAQIREKGRSSTDR
eukprot:gene9945-10806_t